MINLLFKFSCLIICTLILSISVYAGSKEEMYKKYTGSPEYEKMKTLAGTWEGTSSMGDEGEKVTVKYEMTSADSAIVETLFPGTPHEMVSVYYDDNGKLSMTHYCMIKNQPNMILKNSNAKVIGLEFSGGTNLKSESDPHMHALNITFEDDNNIVQEWIYYEDGKEKGANKLKLSRVNN